MSSNGTCFDPEFMLRVIFNQIRFVECLDSQPQNRSMTNDVVINFVSGPSRDGVIIEFSNILSHWISKLCGGSHANTSSQVDMLILKILNEKIPISKGSSDLCNMKGLGPINPPLLLPLLLCDSSQRKYDEGRRAVAHMLVWLRKVALDPGGMTECFDLRDPEERKCWKLVLSTRQVMLQVTQSRLEKGDFPNPKKQKTQRTSRTQRTLKTQIESAKIDDKLDLGKRRSQRILDLLKRYNSQFERKRIPIGRSFQADIPEWIDPGIKGVVVDNKRLIDERYKGCCMWSVKGIGIVPPLEKQIGKGRDDVCSCSHKGSAKCIRYHVRMARLRLKSQLGDAFITMGFSNIRENVSRLLLRRRK